MSDGHDALPPDCSAARSAVQERLDAPIEARAAAALQRHLDQCSACRDYADDLQRLQESLQALPEIPFPDEALEQVFQRTSRAEGSVANLRARRVSARVWYAAAAVLLITAGLSVWNTINTPTDPPDAVDRAVIRHDGQGYTDDEIEQAALEARQVLALTALALNRGRDIALHRVLAAEVSPALQRVPIRLPAAPDDDADPGRS